jgi:hypothetical protein
MKLLGPGFEFTVDRRRREKKERQQQKENEQQRLRQLDELFKKEERLNAVARPESEDHDGIPPYTR